MRLLTTLVLTAALLAGELISDLTCTPLNGGHLLSKRSLCGDCEPAHLRRCGSNPHGVNVARCDQANGDPVSHEGLPEVGDVAAVNPAESLNLA